MGRKDAVQFTLEWAARARALGAAVTFQAGWESRGNGTTADYEGAIVHHTASNSSAARPNPTLGLLIGGRSDLPGPLCNVTGPWCTIDAPKLHVVAAHPANHAGASGGRSMGPLPVTGLFNKRVYGLEIDYAGSSAMTDGQRRAALIFARSVCDVLGRSSEYVRAHMESSITGKWDPGYAPGKTIDMAAFRRDAATLTNTQEEDLDAEQNRKLDQTYRIVALLAGVEISPKSPAEKTIGQQVAEAPVGYGVEKITGGKQALGAVVAELFERTRQETSDDADTKTMLTELIAARASAAAPAVDTSKLQIDYAQLAAALAPKLADEWDRRARDGDAKTGPAT